MERHAQHSDFSRPLIDVTVECFKYHTTSCKLRFFAMLWTFTYAFGIMDKIGSRRNKDMLYYCKRCGRIVDMESSYKKICDYCENVIQPVPHEYLDSELEWVMDSERKQEFMERYIWSSLEFDPERHKQMKQWLDTRWDNRPETKVGNPYGIECPYCHSTFIERTSGANRSTWFADASAIGKQFQCLYCKAFF